MGESSIVPLPPFSFRVRVPAETVVVPVSPVLTALSDRSPAPSLVSAAAREGVSQGLVAGDIVDHRTADIDGHSARGQRAVLAGFAGAQLQRAAVNRRGPAIGVGGGRRKHSAAGDGQGGGPGHDAADGQRAGVDRHGVSAQRHRPGAQVQGIAADEGEAAVPILRMLPSAQPRAAGVVERSHPEVQGRRPAHRSCRCCTARR